MMWPLATAATGSAIMDWRICLVRATMLDWRSLASSTRVSTFSAAWPVRRAM